MVTGGANGIGLASVEAPAEAGYISHCHILLPVK
jgi:NAD(P)-dependent dehydrogenase (short-subunit alcohol dehydrogenase family)